MTKAEKMFALVTEWKSSDLSQKVFCQENGINVSTFAYWVAKKKRTEEPSWGFVPIELGNEPVQKVEITYPNGIKLSVAYADPGIISQLIGLWRDV